MPAKAGFPGCLCFFGWKACVLKGSVLYAAVVEYVFGSARVRGGGAGRLPGLEHAFVCRLSCAAGGAE